MTSNVKKFKLVFLGEQSGEHCWIAGCSRPPRTAVATSVVLAINTVPIEHCCVFIAVGKTSIITKFMYDSFDETYQVTV